jgi:hypothetical protein
MPFERFTIDNTLLQQLSAFEIVGVVHELHQRGYEQLRLFCGLSPSGMCWRWFVYPKVMMQKDYRYERDDYIPFGCFCGTTNELLPKKKCVFSIEKFIRDNSEYLIKAKGADKEYLSWFESIVEHAKRGDFPVAFSDSYNRDDCWKFISGEKLPYPPFSAEDGSER